MATAYWSKRVQRENEKLLGLEVEEVLKQLRRIYKEQSEILLNEITRAFIKYQDPENGTLNDLLRANKYRDLIGEFNQRARVLGSEEVLIDNENLIDMFDKTQSVIERFAPKNKMIRFGVPSAVKAEDAVKQIWVADGLSFSDRIWLDKGRLVKQLTDGLVNGIMRGEPAQKIAFDLEKRLGVSLSNANRIARTEMAHTQIVASAEKYKEMFGSTAKAQYLASGNAKCCDECEQLNGKLFTFDEIEQMIPQHPNCCCSYLIVFEEGNE